MKTHILVTTNNFWVGGRETYIGTYLTALARHGVTAELLCSSVQPGVAAPAAFCSVTAAGGKTEQERLRSWLELGAAVVAERRPALIWAHHYDLLPAWLLAETHGIPLLVTFHGPPYGAGRPNDVLEALGMTLVVHRSTLVSGVSDEICARLEALAGRPATRLPNVVEHADGAGSAAPAWPPRRWLLVTRQEKLEHMRAAVRLFAAYRERFPDARLSVVSSAFPATSHPLAGLVVRVRRGLEVLGYRWCRSEGTRLWRALAAIQWLGHSPAPRSLMRASDVVLGMGRVVLEGLAEGRPALLVGYDDVHGLVEERRWEELAHSNFSGRGVAARDLSTCVQDLVAPLPPPLPGPERFAPEAHASRLLELASSGSPPPRADSGLAGELCRMLLEGADSAALFRRAAARLSEPEWESFFHLSRG